jgi:hypothetical protein
MALAITDGPVGMWERGACEERARSVREACEKRAGAMRARNRYRYHIM